MSTVKEFLMATIRAMADTFTANSADFSRSLKGARQALERSRERRLEHLATLLELPHPYAPPPVESFRANPRRRLPFVGT